jgi:ATP synthase protein I
VFVRDSQSVQGVKRLLAVQLMACLLLPAIALLFFEKEAVISVFFGALTAYIPSLIFANKMFQYQGARAAKQIVKSFDLGECLKILSTVLLFSLVFVTYKQIVPLAFFISYIAMLLMHWFSSIMIGYTQNKMESD